MSSSTLGHRREFHSPSGSELSPIQLVSPLPCCKDSVEKLVELQLTSLNLISFPYQKNLERSMSILKTELSSQDCTLKEPNGILRSSASWNQMLWSCIAQCQSFTSSQSKSVPSLHKICTNAHVTTTQPDKELFPRNPSCSRLILRLESTLLNSG